MPVLRELGVGHTVWQLIIGRDQFNAASGLVYPDGTVRRIAQVEAVMNAPAAGFTEKPDEQGLPIRHDIPVLQAKYFEACLRDGVTEVDVARAGDARRIAPGPARSGYPRGARRRARPWRRRGRPTTRATTRRRSPPWPA